MDIFTDRTARPMLIAGESEPFDSGEYQYELKMDGVRCLAYLEPDETDLVNRNGRRLLPQFPELVTLHMNSKKRCIIDGEMIVGTGSKSEFELIKQRALARQPPRIKRLSGDYPCMFVALDILYLGNEQMTNRPLFERQGILRENVSDGSHMTIVRAVDARGIDFFRVVKERGLEGVIAKRKDSVYRMGKRTREWVKIKNWAESAFVVCGYVRSDRSAVASLVLGQYNGNGMLMYRGRVALGMNREEFRIVAAQSPAAHHPFSAPPPKGCAGALWVKPALVCAVGFMCWTDNLRLRQPFFKSLLPGRSPGSARGPDAPVHCTAQAAAHDDS